MNDKVFILRWNPQKCTFSEADFLQFRKYYFLKELDWHIDDYGQFDVNDRNHFFMISTCPMCQGIIMKGVLDNPFLKMDSLHKKYNGPFGNYPQAFYSKLNVEYIATPDKNPFISLDKLKKHIPNFNWCDNIDGQFMPAEIGKRLLGMWERFEQDNWPYFCNLEFERENHIDYDAVDRIVNYNICPNLNELLINKSERERVINNWMMTGEESLICANTKFTIEFINNERKGIYFQLFIRPDKILYIRCNGIYSFESNMVRYRPSINEFYIIRTSIEYLEVIINGFKIICKNVEFIRLEEYSGDEPLSNICMM